MPSGSFHLHKKHGVLVILFLLKVETCFIILEIISIISHNAKTKQNGPEVKAVRMKARWNHLKDDATVNDSQQLHQF